MADINDRLERLSKREELARRAHQPPPTGVPAEGLGDDFLDVLAAVARAVRRHPGLSVMVAAIDGRPGRSVVRVTERDGAVETALVATPGASARAPGPGRHAHPAPPAPASASAAPADAGGSAGPGVWYHRPSSDRQPYSRRGASRPVRAVAEGRPAPPGHAEDAVGDDGTGPPAAERQPGLGPSGLVTLPADTRQVVARLAQLLRDDPSLASGWGRDR